jgi:hypothetical protein
MISKRDEELKSVRTKRVGKARRKRQSIGQGEKMEE